MTVYQVKLYKKALKSLKKIPSEYQVRIKRILPRLKENPFSLDLKKLGSPHQTSHRLRIGDYRIFLDIDTETKIIIIVDIKRRTSQTYQ